MVRDIKWTDIVAFFNGLIKDKVGRPSQTNYLNALRSYFKALGRYKSRFKEIDIGLITKYDSTSPPVHITYSLF